MARTANFARNGFMFYKPRFAVAMPEPVAGWVASGYNTADIYPGDPVQRQTDGSWIRTPAGTPASNLAHGVVMAVTGFRDSRGVFVRNGKYLPSGTTYTADAERSQLLIWLADQCLFIVDADDGVTNTTVALARATVGENCDHVFGTADQGLGLSPALLDISTRGTANAQWRVEEVVERPANDVTLTRAAYVVRSNAPISTTGV